MTDDKSKSSELPAELDDIANELDRWDEMFDALHVDDATALTDASKMTGDAALAMSLPDPDLDDDYESQQDFTAATTPAPDVVEEVVGRGPVARDYDDVATRAEGIGRQRRARALDFDDIKTHVADEVDDQRAERDETRILPRRRHGQEDQPTRVTEWPVETDIPASGERAGSEVDVDPAALFGADEIDLDDAPRALGDLLSESTSIARSAGREESQVFTSAPRLDQPGSTRRRGPALVRREDLARRRGLERRGDDDEAVREFEHQAVTNVVHEDVISHMAESAQQFFSEQPPEFQLELDGDFYDDIEIAETSAQDTTRAPTPDPVAPATSARRKTTAHIVRRAPAGEQTGSSAIPSDIEAEMSDRVALADLGSPDAATTEAAFDDLRTELEGIPSGARAVPEPVYDDNDSGTFIGPAPIPAASPRSGARSERVTAPPPPGFVPRMTSEPDFDITEATGEDDIPVAPVRSIGPEGVDQDLETALSDMTALDTGSLEPVDIAPALPAPHIEVIEPTIDFDAIHITSHVSPSLEDRTEEWAVDLLWFEKELELASEPAMEVQLHAEAGRLAERLGDLERARSHFDAALQADPHRVSALRSLRRVERALGNWSEVVKLLDAEIPIASSKEKRALASFRAELLMAIGEQDLARVSIGELVDEAPRDVRALLANLELAYVDGRLEEFSETLERLGQVLADASVASSLQLLRAHLMEKAGGDPSPAYRAAVESRAQPRAALGGLAGRLLREGDVRGAVDALGELAESSLAENEPGYAAAVAWRRIRLLEEIGDADGAREATERITRAAPRDPFLLELCASAAERRGDHAAAAQLWTKLTELAVSPLDRAQGRARAAALYAGPLAVPDKAVIELQQIVAEDPTDDLARMELALALEAAGDVAALDALDRAALEADPASAVHYRLRIARRHARAANHDEAVHELVTAAPPGTHPLIDEAMCDSLRVTGAMPDLLRTFDRIAAADPPYIEPISAHRRKARIAERVARAAEPGSREPAVRAAVAGWRRVSEIEPQLESAHASLVRLATSLDDRELLLDVLASAQAASPPARAVSLALQRSRELVPEEGDAEQAEDVLREAQSLAPDDPRITWELVARLGAAERWREVAAVMLDRAATVERSDEANHLRYRAAAILIDKVDDPAAAAEALSPLVAEHPQFSAGTELLASIRGRIGGDMPISSATDRSAAVEPTRQAPGDAFARLVREAESVETSDPRRATDLYQHALSIRPGSPLARDGLTRAASAAGESAPLAELAIEDLKAAERMTDAEAKADAYEELARIDADLRGDPASALLGWEQAVDCDPTRMSALRALEKSYVSTARNKDLLGLYQRLIAAVDDSADAVPLALERARFADKLNLPHHEVLLDYRRAFARDPRCRMALFRLESQARAQGFSVALAELEQAAADYFERDPRARAAFLTRAGETLVAIGDIDAATEKFRLAAEVVEGHAPALTAWREAALVGERWRDLAEAAVRASAFADTDEERARLCHLAGVALMDKALDGEGATDVLRKVIAVDPLHEDTFARLRVLYDEQGLQEDLAQLIDVRLGVETSAAIRIRLHHELASIHRNFLDDREAARLHLRRVLELDPKNLVAISELSDIAWELGAWADAAETLIARARLESNPRVLKGIFYRLGTIYADHLPDPTWAMKSFQKVLSYDPRDESALERIADLAMQIGEWKLALGACEQLIKLDPPPEQKVAHFHRVARVYQEGFQDQSRAERAYRIAVDVDPTNATALNALIMFYRDAGDARSARVHLDRVAANMRNRLHADPADARAYEMIARTMHARSQLGVTGSLAMAQCAAEAAQMLGGTDQALGELAAEAGRARPRLARLDATEVDDILFPSSVSGELRSLFVHFGDRVAKHVGVDIRRWGVGRSDKARRGADPAVSILFETAEAAGHDVDVYVSTRHPGLLGVEPTSPISIIVGSELLSADRAAEIRFIAGRAVKLATTWLAVPARMPADEFGVLLAGILRQFKPDFAPAGLDPELVAAEQQRLRRLIPSGMVQDLAPYALGLAGPEFDHRRIWNGIAAAGNRAGLLAAGSAAAAVAVIARVSGYRDIQQAVTDPTVAGLLRFAVSEDHAQLCSLLEG